MLSTRNIPQTKEPKKYEINGGTNIAGKCKQKVGKNSVNNNKLYSNY